MLSVKALVPAPQQVSVFVGRVFKKSFFFWNAISF